jgi:predicted RNase H-like nuclease (RuvC/YqgF family)
MRHSIAGILLFTVAATLFAPGARAQEELRVRQLESEVMRLQRELDAQSRRIEDLERSLRNVGPVSPIDATPRPADNSPAWLVTANWDRLRPGMKDLDVIAVLGRPTSVRTDPDGKSHALLYALELGPNAVLAGNVRMSDAGVAEINRPTLK